MNQKQKIKLQQGEEYAYEPNRNTGPIVLTYVEKLTDDTHRFFSSEFPSLDYHIGLDRVRLMSDDVQLPSPAEAIHTFSGADSQKKKAYEILLAKRGKTQHESNG